MAKTKVSYNYNLVLLIFFFFFLPLFFLFLLFYVEFLWFNVSNLHNSWRKLQGSSRTSNYSSFISSTTMRSESNGEENMRLLIRRLVIGSAHEELVRNGVTCVSDVRSTVCVTTSAVRITTGDQPTVYLSSGQNLTGGKTIFLKPYPRYTDANAMRRTKTVKIVSKKSNIPVCDVNHSDPAVVFSTGGYVGNFFHEINDVILPLFITTSPFRSRVHLVVSDHKPNWPNKYRRLLDHVSSKDLIVASSASVPVDERVHCFPGAIVGVKYHNYLACNTSDAPSGLTTLDFKKFLHESFSLKSAHVGDGDLSKKKPILILISRRKSRMLLNEDKVVRLASKLGFHVELAPPSRMKNISDFATLVNSGSVLMGVHGAGLTNMVFLPIGAVVLQVVPWALDWPSKTYYGVEPTARFGLKYVEYRTTVEESSLYRKYKRDHPVITKPWLIQRQGYNVSKPVFMDGQDVKVDLSRFKKVLLQTKRLLPFSSLKPMDSLRIVRPVILSP